MRKKDQKKTAGEKAAKTINFDKAVLDRIEDRARKAGSNASNLVNLMCRQVILTDVKYYEEMARYHYLEFQKYKYLKEQALNIRETK